MPTIRDLFVDVDRAALLDAYNRDYEPVIDAGMLDRFLDTILALPIELSDRLIVTVTKLDEDNKRYFNIAGIGFDYYDEVRIKHSNWDVEWRPAVEVLGYSYEDLTGLNLTDLELAAHMLEELGVYHGSHRT